MIHTVFNWCVDILNWLAGKCGMTYEEINVWIFCVIWPLFTLTLIVMVIVLWMRLKALDR